MVVYPDDNLSIIVLTNLMGAVPERFTDEIAGFYVPEMKADNGFGLSIAANSPRQQLDSRGYESAFIVAEELRIADGMSFNENELNIWGYRLIDHLKVRPAMEIFRLNTHLFPESANTYDSLGEAYGLLGQTQDAIDSYERVLELDPASQNAAHQLERLSRQVH
jgi:tetratricopeptide (TPR) repeat protein